MEEVQVIDCPPTPGSSEILLSNTPPSSSLLDMLDSSSSAEEVDNCTGEADEGTTESGRSSPPPKCAICLGKCRQKCYTDSCRHQFCYRCLLEWSKIKAECPLCKQVFRSIIYDQKTEHIIFPPTTPPASGSAATGSGGPPQVYHRLDFTLSQPPRFTYSATLRVQPNLQQLQRLQQLFLHQSGDVQRFSREFPDDTIPSRQNGPEWRRYIYHRKLHARPLADVNGRLRECSASFYRENPAQIHRLMPWINRELIALCRGNPSQVTLILEDFPNLLMSHDITSPSFRERVSYWGRARTVHFVHELLNFARSPFDMIGYDRCVQYDPYYNNNVVVLSSSSSSSSGSGLSGSEGEDDVVRVVDPIPGTSGMATALGEATGRRGRTQFTIETRSSDQTVIMTGSFGGAGVSGIVSVSTSGTQTGGPVAGASSSASFADLTRMHPLTSLASQTSRLEDGANISLSSDDSDDCRIVGALKPPHLRTPEMVSLESESDSDVVFVNDDNNTTEDSRPVDNAAILEQFLNATAVADVALDQNGIPKLETSASVSEYNNGASTSSGSGGGCMKKYYAKPKLNRFVNGIGFKSIYEASESEKSKEVSLHSDSDSSSHDEVKFNIRGHPAINQRKRKTTKQRRSRASSTGSSDDLTDQSSTSDSESSKSSSLSSSMSSSSDDDSGDDDFHAIKPPKKILKNKSNRSQLSSSRKSSKRRSGSTKKRSKVKTRKHSSTKRNRKRSKTAKSSSESGKGTSVSATSVPSVEAVPSGSTRNTSPKASPSCSKKRKLRSAIVRPSGGTPSTRRSSFKKRRKAPICSELITSTDSSCDEQKQMPPAAPGHELIPSSASISENNSSDSEGQCTIASLIRAAVQQTMTEPDQQHEDKQNTSSTSSSHSASTPNTSSHADTSSSSPLCSAEPGPAREGDAFPQEDVSVSQAIAVGAEVEL